MTADLKYIIEEANKFAISEIEKFKSPHMNHFHIANKEGQILAEHFGADANIVMLGTILMDCKLGECIKNGNAPAHIKESYDRAKLFLDNYDIEEDLKNQILNCVEAHHNTKLAKSIEAEIVANADCYRFLSPAGIFTSIQLFGKRTDNISEIMNSVDKKVEEKWNILSLDLCKDELKDSYEAIKYLINNLK